ncbi:ABC transporter substrate-binding protein [Bartonella sp. HY038]|uniref:ABC transporter substrate-binding protein n=1 Tax=Bartonella sp. HY038 TaxID=2759660 RepID=UPI0015F7C44E|nr:ABC transporter substrate-binding protein [Bartonella sp. HY038]
MFYKNSKKIGSIVKMGLIALSMSVPMSFTSTIAFAETVIKAVMHSDLRITDPILTTAHITRNHGYMIYDVLIAQDSNLQPRQQMADWTISEDGKTYQFTLRDGLQFHDGSPVTSKDVIASLKRWGARDSGGQLLLDATEEFTAPDDKTILWKLKKPFNPLLSVLSKESSVPAFIMPERIANTPADQAISEFIGSGPFKMVVSEFKPGLGVTYEKFADYIPRDEPPDGLAGGKVVYVDKVQWISMPDRQTSINALANGEVDYLEQVTVDLIPLIEGDEDIIVEKRDKYGFQTMGRMNFKYPPFDNQKIRQAALYALSQQPILANLMASPEYYKVCGAILGCNTLLASEDGASTLTHNGDIEKAKALLKEAGYDGTPVVIMQPTDTASLLAQPIVAAQQLRAVGFNVDLQPMDWQTLVGRRASMVAPKDGGWNLFFTNWGVPEISSPLISPMLNGRGDKGWFGWPVDDALEQLKQEFIAANNDDERKIVAEKIQKHVLDFVIYIPLGEYQMPQGRHKNVTDMLPTSIPVFWNIKKSD